MKIMNISSPLRTLPKLLALLVALACTRPLIHAKVGEQENWYQFQWPTVSTETNFLNIPLNDGASLDNDSNAISQFGEDLDLVSG